MDLIELEESDLLHCLKRCVAACVDSYRLLLGHVTANGFDDPTQEISFFKTMKPQIGGLLQYYGSLLRIELGKPAGSFDVLCRYYSKALDTIKKFHEDNRFLVTYYRSDETFLDDRLFVRVDGAVSYVLGDTFNDGGISSLCDGFAATLLANERLAAWLSNVMTAGTDKPAASNAATGIKWTDSKAALVELLYALHRRGSFNGGQASLKDIARLLESACGVDLGNYYRTFQEIRIRKTGRTSFIDSLKTGLIQYMDETDLNYKG